MGRRGHNGAVCGNFSRTLFWWIPSVHRIPARISTSKLGYTLVPGARRPTSGSPTPTRKKSNVPAYVPNCLHSAPILQLLRFFFFSAQGRRRNSSPDRFRHTGFLFQPQQRHMERPYFYQGRDYRRMKRRFNRMSHNLSCMYEYLKARPCYYQAKVKEVLWCLG